MRKSGRGLHVARQREADADDEADVDQHDGIIEWAEGKLGGDS